ncbi:MULTISPECIES: type I-E CRISPR-associated protein Cas7/Cse4/CasC [unclassified Halomonas]|uniref:type I-E CRISPR-associated protein Cas7/Cse4/CasC n=1 Tax=unclassified Halomonas TaxID=2609666 RepID=UPI0020A15AF7|nr:MULTISPECIES: type I-E CRISPR-associated protein Cas7/Cse4/CasC [unclassified Halomonas]MCP1312788.1 type I-E CRISPR-associated protein Cas7/Cse4/CasC [Halomonas sp. 707D7]MCP1325293.1 type I-E CRISPR-associated protein Cas7/Cse4/CasC [Halomonas sp. 707D4]
MSHFIQLHLLTSYPPSNLNRDDLGRPKTAFMGGARRLRVSSQSLKRNWRTSDLFESAVDGHKGTRTKRLGKQVFDRMVQAGANEKVAGSSAEKIAGVFGKLRKVEKGEKHEYEIEQLVHVGPEELNALEALADTLGAANREPSDDELKGLLARRPTAVDVALFGRMLAAAPSYNVEAACQVAHAITVHAAEVEDDYFTAVDDLNTGDEDRGAAHIGEAGFAAGLFYLYLCIDRDLLVENLQGNTDLADRAIAALVESAVKISPKGKQNSFGSRAHASYVLAEKGDQQPRSLSASFLQPVMGEGQGIEAIRKLETQAQAFDDAYGAGADRRFVLSATPEYEAPALKGDLQRGNLQELLTFLKGDD